VKEKTIEYYYRDNGYDNLLQVNREREKNTGWSFKVIITKLLFNTPHPYFLEQARGLIDIGYRLFIIKVCKDQKSNSGKKLNW